MTHDVTVSAAECAECEKMRQPVLMRMGLISEADMEKAHLQAQKDAWWLAGQEAMGDNPISHVLNNWQLGDGPLGELAYALRAQMEAKK